MGYTYEVCYWGRPESKWLNEQNQYKYVTVWTGESFFAALWQLWKTKKKHPCVSLTWRK